MAEKNKWTEQTAVEAARNWYAIQRQIEHLSDPSHLKLTVMQLLFPEDLGHYALPIDYALWDKTLDAATWLVKEGHAEALVDVPGLLSRYAEGGEVCCVLDAMQHYAPRVEQLREKANAFLKAEAERNAYRAKHCSHTDQVSRKREAARKAAERETQRTQAKERIRQLESQIATDYAADAADDAA